MQFECSFNVKLWNSYCVTHVSYLIHRHKTITDSQYYSIEEHYTEVNNAILRSNSLTLSTVFFMFNLTFIHKRYLHGKN